MDIPLKYRILLWVVGVTLGIPTSYYGVTWMQAKLVKQQVNCISDAYEADYSSEAATTQASTNLANCQKGIDPRKGTVRFMRDELKRAGH